MLQIGIRGVCDGKNPTIIAPGCRIAKSLLAWMS